MIVEINGLVGWGMVVVGVVGSMGGLVSAIVLLAAYILRNRN